MKLLLFDIDGVIIEDASREHKKEGIEKVYGIKYNPKLKHSGMTDKQIIYEELKLHGLNEEEINSKIKECMEIIIDVFKKSDKSNIIALDGIKELLEKLSKNKNIIIGLLTGNFEGIANEKMRHLGLKDYFKVGSFGTDPHEKRSDLVRVAKEKTEKLGYTVDEIFIIGDTPRDIQTGKETNESNVRTVAITTGLFSVDELRKHNPDYLFENLKDKKFIELFN